MYDFKLKSFTEFDNRELNAEVLLKRQEKFLKKLSNKHPNNEFIESIVTNMAYGEYWTALRQIDGEYTKDSLETIADKQARTLTTLNKKELSDFINIVANVAMQNAWVDLNRECYLGNTILFEEIYLKSDSIFKSIMNEELVLWLHNARFWENLCFMGEEDYEEFSSNAQSTEIVRKYLSDDYDKLKIDFIPDIYISLIKTIDSEIYFKDSKSVDGIYTPEIILDNLSEIHTMKYLDLIKRIDSEKELFDMDYYEVGIFLAPYVNLLYKLNIEDADEEDYEDLYEGMDYFEKEIFGNPLIFDYFKKSEPIQKELGQRLNTEMNINRLEFESPLFQIFERQPNLSANPLFYSIDLDDNPSKKNLFPQFFKFDETTYEYKTKEEFEFKKSK